MKEEELKSLIGKVLNETPKPTYGKNYSFHCPYCKHRKRKLEVNLDPDSKTNPYHCWVCDFKGKNLFNLFKYVKAPKSDIDKLKKILGQKVSSGNLEKHDLKSKIKNIDEYIPKENKYYKKDIVLPPEAKSLREKQHHDFDYNNAYNYVINTRGLSYEDIVRYNLLYTDKDSVKFPNKIIIPSYDADGKLNYFFTRDFYDSNKKHKNPSGSRSDKIMFENLISFQHPLTIVEGGIDAIKVRINTTPSLTKMIPKTLMERIIFYQTPINLMYDYDVFWGSKYSDGLVSKLETLLKHNVSVHIIKLPPGKDPGDLSFIENQQLIKNGFIKVTHKFIMKLKLKI